MTYKCKMDEIDRLKIRAQGILQRIDHITKPRSQTGGRIQDTFTSEEWGQLHEDIQIFNKHLDSAHDRLRALHEDALHRIDNDRAKRNFVSSKKRLLSTGVEQHEEYTEK